MANLRKLTQRTEAVVKLAALRHNIQNVQARLHAGCRLIAVLKGDGYGHGDGSGDGCGLGSVDDDNGSGSGSGFADGDGCDDGYGYGYGCDDG